MCGRYYMDEETAGTIQKFAGKAASADCKLHRGEICPSQYAAVLIGKNSDLSMTSVRSGTGRGSSSEKNSGLSVAEMQWGFPQYQKKGLLINARAETVLERKMFRDSVLHRRCVIPAKLFYEWDAKKNKVSFQRKDAPVLYMAGFYNRFGDFDHFIIITTDANLSVRPVHDRMPLLLDDSELQSWIYDDQFLEYALHKQMPDLDRFQEYEQQSLFL